MDEFRKARRQGYAIIDQELEDGLVAVSVPLRDARGAVLAAANVCGHVSHLTRRRSRKALPAGAARLRPAHLALAGRETALPEAVRSTIQKRDAKGTIRHGGEWLALWSDPDSMKTPAELQREAAERNAALPIEHQLAAAARARCPAIPTCRSAFGARQRDRRRGVFETLQDASSRRVGARRAARPDRFLCAGAALP